jgi:hypothetical protein
MSRLFMAAALMLVLSTEARADAYALPQWQELDASHRTGYVRGFIDTYLTFPAGHENNATSIAKCLAGKKLNYEKMAADVEKFAVSNGAFETRYLTDAMPIVIVDYLLAMCNPP